MIGCADKIGVSMSMRVIEQNNVTIIEVVNEKAQALIPMVDPLLKTGKRAFIFDLAPSDFLNSVNVAAIIAARNKIVAAGGKVVVCNLANNIKAVFRILRLDHFFDLELDLAGALACSELSGLRSAS
jgi:anti-anti-sigma factor